MTMRRNGRSICISNKRRQMLDRKSGGERGERTAAIVTRVTSVKVGQVEKLRGKKKRGMEAHQRPGGVLKEGKV